MIHPSIEQSLHLVWFIFWGIRSSWSSIQNTVRAHTYIVLMQVYNKSLREKEKGAQHYSIMLRYIIFNPVASPLLQLTLTGHGDYTICWCQCSKLVIKVSIPKQLIVCHYSCPRESAATQIKYRANNASTIGITA